MELVRTYVGLHVRAIGKRNDCIRNTNDMIHTKIET